MSHNENELMERGFSIVKKKQVWINPFSSDKQICQIYDPFLFGGEGIRSRAIQFFQT